MNTGGLTINNIITYVIDPAILLIFSAGLIVFLWGLVEFMMDPSDTTRRNTGKQHMLWGIIGMFIMVSTGAIVTLVDDTFGLGIRESQAGRSSSSRSVQSVTPDFNLGKYPTN